MEDDTKDDEKLGDIGAKLKSKYYFGDPGSEKLLLGNGNPYQLLYNKLDLTFDTSSSTKDKLRGEALKSFYLVDAFSKKHIFEIQKGDPITTFFPIEGGQVYTYAKGINGSNKPYDKLRTGCNAAHTWCQATFTNEGDYPYVRGKFVFLGDSDILSKSKTNPIHGLVKALKGGAKEMINLFDNVKETIHQIFTNTLEELPKLIQINGEFVNKYKTEIGSELKVCDWVRDNISYDRNYGGYLVTTEQVLSTDRKYRFGCCLEFANVAVALLRAMGCDKNQVKVVIGTRPHPDKNKNKIILHAFYIYKGNRYDPTPNSDEDLNKYKPLFEYNDDPKQSKTYEKNMDSKMKSSVMKFATDGAVPIFINNICEDILHMKYVNANNLIHVLRYGEEYTPYEIQGGGEGEETEKTYCRLEKFVGTVITKKNKTPPKSLSFVDNKNGKVYFTITKDNKDDFKLTKLQEDTPCKTVYKLKIGDNGTFVYANEKARDEDYDDIEKFKKKL